MVNSQAILETFNKLIFSIFNHMHSSIQTFISGPLSGGHLWIMPQFDFCFRISVSLWKNIGLLNSAGYLTVNWRKNIWFERNIKRRVKYYCKVIFRGHQCNSEIEETYTCSFYIYGYIFMYLTLIYGISVPGILIYTVNTIRTSSVAF